MRIPVGTRYSRVGPGTTFVHGPATMDVGVVSDREPVARTKTGEVSASRLSPTPGSRTLKAAVPVESTQKEDPGDKTLVCSYV